jgi:nucleoside-diphosphate-sugar epimerase
VKPRASSRAGRLPKSGAHTRDPRRTCSSGACGLFGSDLPEVIQTETELEEILTCPSRELIDFVRTLSGRLLILGAGGKMGPTLAVLAQRAAKAAGQRLSVVAVSRFGDARTRSWLEARGVETVSGDLLEQRVVRRLPAADHLVYLVGLKFGTKDDPATTWAINTLVPARICERYPRSRVVALSSGNVYPGSPVRRGGSTETDPLTPIGEYANAAVGRERIFEFHSRRHGTAVALLRLCYAVDLRYGILADIARRVRAGEPIALDNGYFNCVWQGDANEMILRALTLAACPPSIWNLCRPERFSVREIANRLGALLNRPPRFTGREAATTLVVDASRLCATLGPPRIPIDRLLRWAAHWVQHGGRDLGKPTHFEVRDGNY